MNCSCLLCIDLKLNLKWKVSFLLLLTYRIHPSSVVWAFLMQCVLIVSVCFCFFSPLCSNKNRIQQTCTSPTCRCQWMSRSWRTCWNTSAKSFPHGSWGTPVDTAEEWASLGQILVYLHLKPKRAACVMQIRSRSDSSDISTPPSLKRTVRKKKRKQNVGQTVAVFFLTSEKYQKSLCI